MTLILGVLSENGVAIGSDRIAMLGALGEHTVQQETQKIEIIKDRMIVGVSGFIGLGQRIIGGLGEAWEADLSKKSVHDARAQIRDAMWKEVQPELDAAALASRLVGNQIAAASAVCQTLVAAPIRKQPALLQYDHQCASEAATLELPFVSIGSGRKIADPFLAFIKRVLWSDKNPHSVGEAVFATLWTLRHVIKTHAGGGIGGEPQIAVLVPEGQGFNARFLSEDELEEHKQHIQETETSIARFLRFQDEKIEEKEKGD